jgi:amino acid transporter
MSRTQAAGAGPRKASTFHLVFMTYAVICSGAYGLEEMISESGPGLALTTLMLLPLLWALPLSLACAELSSRYPIEGGYYRWARLAFGDFVGYQAGWLVWLSNFTTNATFAVLFGNYLRYWLPDLSHDRHYVIAVALVWAATIMNYRGIRLVGAASVILTILIFLPFVGLTLAGILQWQHNPFAPFAHPERPPIEAFGTGMMIAIWLYSGYEKLTTNAGEVENPTRAFPTALAITVPLVAATYVVPTLAGLAGHGHWRDWGESYYSVVSEALGGPWLGWSMAAGGLISNFCILMVTILGQSRLPMVLAEDGIFPKVFQKTHPRFGTPVASLLVGGLVMTFLVRLPFQHLAGLFSLVQVLAYLLIYASLLRLRRSRPVVPVDPSGRPAFVVPLGRRGLYLMMGPSVAFAVVVIAQTVWHDGGFDMKNALFALALLASGPVTYALFRRLRRPGKFSEGV